MDTQYGTLLSYDTVANKISVRVVVVGFAYDLSVYVHLTAAGRVYARRRGAVEEVLTVWDSEQEAEDFCTRQACELVAG